MNSYIITIKLPRDPNHDPKKKKSGPCPYSTHCTDVTGEHHSFVASYEDWQAIKQSGIHITRAEMIG